MAPERGVTWDSAALFVVDADGSNLRRVTPSSVHAIGPAWSPDGTRLAFDGSDFVVNADGTSVLDIKDDIYTIGVDGSGLARLTDDGISSLPDWTSGGRLAFIRHAAPTEERALDHGCRWRQPEPTRRLARRPHRGRLHDVRLRGARASQGRASSCVLAAAP